MIKRDLELIMREKDRMNDKYAEMVQVMKQTTEELRLLKDENERLKDSRKENKV